jgi:hypothetical protein
VGGDRNENENITGCVGLKDALTEDKITPHSVYSILSYSLFVQIRSFNTNEYIC